MTIGSSFASHLNAVGIQQWVLRSVVHLPTLVEWAAYATVPLPFALLLEALAARAMGPVPEGVIGRWSTAYIRVWLKTGLVDSASDWLSGALFWPLWLRLAGMKSGAIARSAPSSMWCPR